MDAFAGDKLILMASSSKVKDPKAYTLLSEDLSFEPYAIALPRGDAGLRQAVNAALAQIYRDGEIVPIFGKWFGSLGEPTGLELRGSARLGRQPGQSNGDHVLLLARPAPAVQRAAPRGSRSGPAGSVGPAGAAPCARPRDSRGDLG